MHVLVTNDDGPPGVPSPYILPFVKALKQQTDWEISVVVPHTQRSWIGKAHLIDQNVYPAYLYVDYETSETEGPFDDRQPDSKLDEWVLLSGTPASCANIGIHHVNNTHKGPVDLVLSGPNFGRNSTALYIMSSGTIGAAMEAALCGVKSIGLSYAFETRHHDWNQIAEASSISVKLIDYLYKNWDSDAQLYSINVPIYVKDLKAAKIVYAPILQNQWGTLFESWDYYDVTKNKDGNSSTSLKNAEDESDLVGNTEATGSKSQRKHFRWKPDFDAVNKSVDVGGPGTDGWALKQGNISVTPLRASFLGVQKQGEITLPVNADISNDVSNNSKNEDVLVYLNISSESYEYAAWASALDKCGIKWTKEKPASTNSTNGSLFEYGDYDSLDHGLLMANDGHYFACAYIYRKALIRKHYLANTIAMYSAKNPDSVLKNAFPESFNVECDYAEFLDDSLDEAYELRQELENDPEKLWILKPSMSDRAQGINVFKGIQGLQQVFDDLEGGDPDGGLVSQLRHFIVQDYISSPLLVDKRKFHIRTYVLAVGALKVFVYEDMLALFASEYYDKDSTDLNRHLTNTCFQASTNEITNESGSGIVKRFQDLQIDDSDKTAIIQKINGIVGELFKAAAADRINFQPLPNALEMYGLDFLVDEDLNVHILEVNAYPDFKQTGSELKSLVDEFILQVVRLGVSSLTGSARPSSSNSNNAKIMRLVYDNEVYK